MSNDTTPIISPSSNPPSYVQSQREFTNNQNSTAIPPGAYGDAVPPPYPPSYGYPPAAATAPPIYPPTYIFEKSGPSQTQLRVVHGPVILVPLSRLGVNPCYVVCPNCANQVMTVTEAQVGAITCFASSLCCCLAWPCACLPFCIPELQDVKHSCPACNSYIGTYARL